MDERSTSDQADSMWVRMRQALGPAELPSDDRGRMRMVVDNLVLHLHPAKVPERTLKWTYTWGLGGLSALLLTTLIMTGVFLEVNYTPSPAQAYQDVLNLRLNTWFGDLLRNIHHWSANLLVLVAALHLLRVFYTGGHRGPRAVNWIVGVLMLLLVLGANFTGYLLPWDQLAYWAVTVGTSILSYIPWVGESISRLLLGGPEVGEATLLNFYGLHISFIPISIAMLMSLHFWKVRKDGGLTTPKRAVDEPETKMERVTTIPHLVRKELVFAVVWMGVILIWSMLVQAPLEGIANPEVSPNPAKAPWYFMGLQEMLLHFHPLVGAVIIPGLALGALLALPFYDLGAASVGVYFRSVRGKALASLSVGAALLLTPGWVLLDEVVLNWPAWLPEWPALISNGMVPMAFLLLGLFLMDEVVQRQFKTSSEERVLFMFTFLLIAFVILTLIGIFFRGEGMQLVWPWLVGAGH